MNSITRRVAVLVTTCFTGLVLFAQVPVSKEPRHHVVFDNGKVRVLNVLIPPGDTTQYHQHSTPSLFIYFTKTITGSQLLNQQPQNGTSLPGTIYFENLSAPHTRIHRVWNSDKDIFHVMDIELLEKDTGFTDKPLQMPNMQLIVDTPWARVYRAGLARWQSVTIEISASAFLLVAINSSIATINKGDIKKSAVLKPGDFFWINPGEHFSITDTGDSEAAFALFEVR